MLIHEITLKNLLSFGPDSEPIPLRPINVIIGPNGSGKSNLIEAIALLQAAPTDITKPIRRSGGAQDWIWKGNGRRTARIESIVDMYTWKAPARVKHAIEFINAYDGSVIVYYEKIENGGDDPHGKEPSYYYFTEKDHYFASSVKDGTRSIVALKSGTINRDQSILAQLRDMSAYPEVSGLSDKFKGIRIYKDWALGRNSPPRLLQPADMPNKWLEEDASNLGLVLKRLTKDFATKKKLFEYFRAVYEDARDFDVDIVGGRVQVFIQEENFTVPATRLSDGTLRYLCLMAILLDPTPPPLVCIDEPELGLHPDLINNIVEMMKAASERTQLIVTTHSDFMVDAFSDDPEAILVCEKRNGCTTMERLNAKRMKPWLKKYRLGELWNSGEIGGKRW